ncbi:MAG: ABC transporter permease subunit [Candidatus Micrarchaeota archaeon]|nr:ABC transporter permease subunit [Candidatus Micrarchaeota archaeon]
MKLFDKEFAEIIRDRAFIGSVLIQFITISMLLFLYDTYSQVMHSPNLKITISVDTNDSALINRLEESGVRVVLANESTIERVNAVINTSSGEIKTDPSNIFSGFAIAKISSVSKAVSFDEALEKSNFSYMSAGLASGNTDFVQMGYGLIVPMAVVMPAMVGLSLSIQNILSERKKRTIELLLVSPISDFDLAFSKTAPYVLSSTICGAAWIAVVTQKIPVYNPLLLVLAELFLSLLLVSLSVIISSIARSMQEANVLSSLSGMALVLSILLPSSSTSEYLPTILIARIASNYPDEGIVVGMLLLAVLSFICFWLAVRSVRRMRRSYS